MKECSEDPPELDSEAAISAAMDGRLLDELTTIVSAAAAAILAARAGSLDARTKADLSPVTAADHAAEAVILEGLARVLPGVAVVSEEAAGTALPASLPGSFVLVDPLDGTRELLAGRDEFTVNVGIVTGGRPRLGIVAAPAQGLIWRGIEGRGAERLQLPPERPASAAQGRTAIRTRPCPRSGLVAAVSRSHLDPQTEAFLARLPVAERRRMRIGGQILPARRRGRRRLSAALDDLRMGRGRRPRRAGGCGRDGDHAGGRAAELRPNVRKLRVRGFRCLGRPDRLPQDSGVANEAGR